MTHTYLLRRSYCCWTAVCDVCPWRGDEHVIALHGMIAAMDRAEADGLAHLDHVNR